MFLLVLSSGLTYILFNMFYLIPAISIRNSNFLEQELENRWSLIISLFKNALNSTVQYTYTILNIGEI